MTQFQKMLVVAVIATFVNACSSVHKGNMAKVVDPRSPQSAIVTPTKPPANLEPKPSAKGLIMSGVETTSLSSPYFGAFGFVFENKSSDWMKIKAVMVDLGGDKVNNKVHVPKGKELVVWAESAQQTSQMHQPDANPIIKSILTEPAKGALMKVPPSQPVTLKNANNTKPQMAVNYWPENHLLQAGFSIPPGLHTNKWLVVHTPKPTQIPFVEKATMTVMYEDGSKEIFELKLRSPITSSVWQRSHPSLTIWDPSKGKTVTLGPVESEGVQKDTNSL